MNLKFTVTGEELSDILLNIAPIRPVFIWGRAGYREIRACPEICGRRGNGVRVASGIIHFQPFV